MCTFGTDEGGQAMYVAMPYFVFMQAIVSWLINGENICYVWNPSCVLRFTVSWARVRMGHVCPSFARNPMMPLCFRCFFVCVAIHLMDRIDVIVSCIIFPERMNLLEPLYRDCVGMASYVRNRLHSRSVRGLQIDSWSRDATSSSIIAYLIPVLHLHFYLSTPLPDIVIVCSPLHDFHVLMDSRVSVLNPFLNLNWWTAYLDFHCQGLPRGVFANILRIWKLVIGKRGSFAEIKENGCHGGEAGKIGNRR